MYSLIGGNTTAQIQISSTTKNAIGEAVKSWTTVQSITGFLDYVGGDADFNSFNAKIRESTHIFVADYIQLDSRITDSNSRMSINGEVYYINMIDNPMGLGNRSQLEFYLNYTGGQ